MTDQGTPKPSDELKQMAMRKPHLREHLMKFKQITGEFPLLVDSPDDYETRRPNVLYPVGGPIFCHVHGDVGQKLKYYTVEPTLSDSEAVILEKVKRKLLSMSGHRDSPVDESGYDDLIEELLEDATYISDGETNFYDRIKQFWNLGKIEINQETYNAVRYR